MAISMVLRRWVARVQLYQARKGYILRTRTLVARSWATTTAGLSRKSLKNFRLLTRPTQSRQDAPFRG